MDKDKIKKTKVELVKYTKSEELMNSITHGIGSVFAIVAMILLLISSFADFSGLRLFSSIVYGLSMIMMFTMSSVYHGLSPKLSAKLVFRVIDHCDIYIFIAGTYTPYCLLAIGGNVGYTIFAIIWILAIIGVLMNAIDLEKYKLPSLIMYLFMGWLIVFSYGTLKESLETAGVDLLLAGGIAYSMGAFFYVIGSKRKYMHSVFHVFVLAGAVLHFISVYLYVM